MLLLPEILVEDATVYMFYDEVDSCSYYEGTKKRISKRLLRSSSNAMESSY